MSTEDDSTGKPGNESASQKRQGETVADLKRKQTEYLDKLAQRLEGLMRDVQRVQPNDHDFMERLRVLRDEARKQAKES